MKEFEEKLNQAEEPEEHPVGSQEPETINAEMPTTEISEESDKAPASLEEELENIRDMFQAELDNATAEENDEDCGRETEASEASDESDGDDTDNEDQEDAGIPEEDLCQCCEERLRDKSIDEDYPYCSECRELMRKYPFGFKGIATLIAVIVLIGVSILYMFPQNAETLSAAITADEYVSQGKLYSGLYAYYDTVSAADTDALPKKVIARCAKAFASLNDYIDAAYIAETYLSENDLKLPTYSFLKDYTVKSETLTAVENAIYDSLSSEETTADDIDDVIAIIDALAETEDTEYDQFYLDYYKYVVMHTLGADLTEQFGKLAEIDEKYGDTEWIHYYDICNAAALLGHIDTAEEYFNRIVEKNSEDGAAYAYYANAYRYSETVDADKMLEIVEQGIAAQGTYSYSASDLYRIQATAYLLKGDTDSALASAETMYSAVYANNYSVTNLFECLYTYALCALAADDTEAYANVQGLLEYNGYEIPQSIIDGAKSEEALINLITDPEGELS